MIVEPDMDYLTDAVLRELREGAAAKAAMAAAEQERVGAATERLRLASIEGVGQPVMEVGMDAYVYWCQREGAGCWEDKQFKKEYLRDNPGARMRTEKTPTVRGHSLAAA